MPTEEEVRRWVRDAEAKIVSEKQDACEHRRVGTLQANRDVTCDQCGKVVTLEDAFK